MKQLAVGLVLLSCAVVGNVHAAYTEWVGARGVNEQDWNVATNWSAGVPAANGTALFKCSSGNAYNVKVTPPSSFVGTILVSNNLSGVSTESYLNNRFSKMVTLGVADGASWIVAGNGHVVATDGIAARLGPKFDGLLEVRKGTSLTIPASLNSAVKVIGAGTVALASASQTAQTKLFAGTVVLPDGDVTYTDTSLLAGHDVMMANGKTVTLDPNDIAFGSIRTFDFKNNESDWSYNGTAWRVGTLKSGPYSPEPPYVRDNVLYMTDDPAQVHTVWYTNRLFRYTDSIGAKFTWTPKVPKDSRIAKEGRAQTQSGNFSIVFQDASPTSVKMPSSPTTPFERNVQSDYNWGFTMYTYQGDNNAHWSWLVNGSKPGQTISLHQKDVEITLVKPIDFTVTVDNGFMAVTMEQEGKSMTVCHNFGTTFSVCNAGGLYFGLSGCSDTWSDLDATVGTPWMIQEISGFKGWYRDPLEGGWTAFPNEEAFTKINGTNWDIKRISKVGGTTEGDACLNSDGSIDFLPATSNVFTIMMSKTSINRAYKSKPIKYSFDIYNGVTKFPVGNWPGISFLIMGSKNNSTWSSSLTYSSNWDWGEWKYGFAFDWNLANGQGQWKYGHIFASGTTIAATDKAGNGPTYSWVSRGDSFRNYEDRDVRVDFIYDPRGIFSQIISTDPRNRNFGQCSYNVYQMPAEWMEGFQSWKNGRDNFIGIRAKAASTDIYEMKLRKFRLMQMTSAEAGKLGTLKVPTGVSSTIAAGDLMEGQTSRVATFDAADLSQGATLIVKPVTGATKVGIDKVIASGAATLSAATGATVEVGEVALDGDSSDSGLALSGNVALGNTISVTIPSSWRSNRNGWMTLIDVSAATTGSSIDPDSVILRDEAGEIPARKRLLRVDGNKLMASFGVGMAIIVR